MKNGTVTLSGAKVILRRYTLDDVEEIYKQLGCNAEMVHYTGWNPYKTLESTKGMLQMQMTTVLKSNT